jgi:hypothetical protein
VIQAGGQGPLAERDLEALRRRTAGDPIATVIQAERRPRDIDRLAERLVLALDDRAAALAGVVQRVVAARRSAVGADRIRGRTIRPVMEIKTVCTRCGSVLFYGDTLNSGHNEDAVRGDVRC